MSEAVFVWNPARHGTVKSAQAAGALIEKLVDRMEPAPDERIEAFIAALTQDYPTPAMQPGQDSAWDAEDVRGYGRQPSAAFGFRLPSTSHTLALMGAILSHAAAAGVAVFDPQRSWVWLPDGQAYPKDAKEARQTMEALASAPRQTAPGWQHWAKLMHLELDPLLLAAGFEDRTQYPLKKDHTHGMFARKIEGGQQLIWLGVERIRRYDHHPDDERLGCWLSVFVQFESIAQAHQAHWKTDHPGTVQALTLDFFLGIREKKAWPNEYKICVEDASGRQQIRDTLLHHVLPFLDQTRTICEMDRMLNRGGAPMADTLPINPSRLMVAKWCGNPRYEEMCRTYIAYAERHPETQRIHEDRVNTIDTFEQKVFGPNVSDHGS